MVSGRKSGKKSEKSGKMAFCTWEIRSKYVVFDVGKLGSGGSKKDKKGVFLVQKGGVFFVGVIRRGRFGPHNLAQLDFF